ncbi:MAG: hypothetical protein U9R54_08705 [Bacteroidota bacterium]|nr:hypothetical protein [Bacteroidota bacterium]
MYKTITIHARSTYWPDSESTDESYIDSDDLSKEIEKQCNMLHKTNYEVLHITPISSGNISNGNGNFQTESIIITAKKLK